MQTSFPAVDALSASKTRIYFNLGTIGRIEAHHVGPKAFYGALVDTNPGLPRPARDLEAKQLRVPQRMPLVLLSAFHYRTAYHFIFDVQEQTARTGLSTACNSGRLEIGFVDGGVALWTAMQLDAQVRRHLGDVLAARKSAGNSSAARDRSWRDKLGLLLLGLPSLFAEVEPEAVGCAHHSAILFSGDRAAHQARLLRGVL